ncbi:putative HTH-type transcriptional regulator [Aliidongia dinghuensis]|uniref:Putative HTH-type transcriptional regulator n=1 Tax=Aliidongia dinghuensis TaxID=1867774 RepID=A0A8J2YRN0_9PROT|nr:PLP-dependent aminotransferase family protein [Aliidongia dinghuensis]GGF05485.1 putative HTH-type transcriptional regulator [Aliidongia dinghuensis]
MKYLGIVEALEADVRAGRVRPGDRLPAQRAIADSLNVDLTTVTRAFNEARRRGLVDAQAGRGSFIREALGTDRAPGAAAGTPPIDLSMNIPPQPATANLRRAIADGLFGLMAGARGARHFQYQDSTGTEQDRAAGADWLERRLGPVPPSRMLVAAGAQSALFAICEAQFRPGDALAVGTVTYSGLRAVAAHKGIALKPLAMDAGGIMPDAFEAACRDGAPRALYVVPSIDNPTTATLPEDRRRQLIAIARRHHVTIIEDDPYWPLRPESPPSLAALAGDITWHIATLSKCATPALRVAYVVAPGGAQALRLAGVLRATTLMAPPLMAALASRWIADGVLDEIVTAIRAENVERQKIAAAVLGEASFAADPHGHHLWLHMPPSWQATDFAEHAGHLGVTLAPSTLFAVTAPSIEAVRLSLGVPDRAALEDALALVASLLAEPSLTTRAFV